MTVAVTLAVLVPLYRTSKVHPEERNDEAVFRAQLEEIQKDLERGAIAPDMAESAKIEVSRRLLAAHKQNQEGKGTSVLSKTRLRIVQLTAIILVPAAALGLYLQVGAPTIPDQPREERLAATQGQADMQVLVARTEEHLRQNPNDGQGWAVIAPVYLRIGEFEKARRAFARALQQYPESTELMMGLAESAIYAGNGEITEEIEKLLRTVSVNNPDLVQPQFYLALAKGQRGEINEALDMWNTLLQGQQATLQWVEAGMREREELIAKGAVATTPEPKLVSAPAPQAGPSSEDVEAAAQMSQQDRAEMINQMVVQLDERLTEEGGTAAEWAQLVQAQMVLGNVEQAMQVIARARENLKNDAAALNQINQLANSLNLVPAN